VPRIEVFAYTGAGYRRGRGAGRNVEASAGPGAVPWMRMARPTTVREDKDARVRRAASPGVSPVASCFSPQLQSKGSMSQFVI